MGEPRAFPAKAVGPFNRVALAAAHVVADPLADVDPWLDVAIDWDRTIAYRDPAPTVPLSRHIFKAPTRFYKTGVVFMAYLNGHQDHFVMVGGQESARSLIHLAELFRLADAAGLLRDPDRRPRACARSWRCMASRREASVGRRRLVDRQAGLARAVEEQRLRAAAGLHDVVGDPSPSGEVRLFLQDCLDLTRGIDLALELGVGQRLEDLGFQARGPALSPVSRSPARTGLRSRTRKPRPSIVQAGTSGLSCRARFIISTASAACSVPIP